MTVQSTLARLEKRLTPQQMVMTMFAPFQKAGTPHEYVVHVIRAMQVEDLATRLRRVSDDVATAMRGRPRQAIEKAKRDAASEYYFLYHLVSDVNEYASSEWESWTLRLLLTATQASSLLAWERVAMDEVIEERGERTRGRLATEYEHALVAVESAATAYSGTMHAVERISRQYFGGAPILFAGAQKALADGLSAVEMLKTSILQYDASAQIDLDHAGDDLASTLVLYWVEAARHSTYDLRGEKGAAERLMDERMTRLLAS